MKEELKNEYKSNLLMNLVLFYLPIILILLMMWMQSPSSQSGNRKSQNEFSVNRAVEDIKMIAKSPHAIGMESHAEVREYLEGRLKSFGLETQIQDGLGTNTRWGLPFRVGYVSNVLGKLKGTGTGDAILLLAHYDSVPNSLGVSDDGSGVSAILETINIIIKEKPPKNDIIVLFSDAEEVGLMGAKAFVENHTWMKKVKFVVNLEARGTSGASLLFETTPQNSQVIETYGNSVSRPMASSFFNDAYKILPNDTDFSEFKNLGITGMNIAYIENVNHYHTVADNLENLNHSSLKNQGDNLLAVVRSYKDKNLNEVGEEVVYFDLLGKFLIHYPAIWVIPITILAVIAFLISFYFKRKTGELSIGGFFLSVLFFFLSLVLATLTSYIFLYIIALFHKDYPLILYGSPSNSTFYYYGMISFILAQTYFLYSFLERKFHRENLYFGALFWWVILAVVTAIFLQGTNYIFSLSVLSISVFVIANHFIKSKSEAIRPLLLMAGSLTPFILLGGIIRHLFIGLGLPLAPVSMVFVVLLLGILLFLFLDIKERIRKFIYIAFALIGVGLVLIGILSAGYSESDLRQSNLFWAMDLDNKKAVWASSDNGLNEWNSQFFGTAPQKNPMPAFFPLTLRTFYQKESKPMEIPPPIVEKISDITEGNVRSVKLIIKSQQNAPIINLIVESEGEVINSEIEGRKISDESFDQPIRMTPWEVRIYGVPRRGSEVSLKLKISNKKLKIRIIEQTYGLPQTGEINIDARPKDLVSAMPFGDSTFTGKTFILD